MNSTTPTPTQDFAALIFVDWADQKHDVCLSEGGSTRQECFQIEQTPEALATWIGSLRQRFGGRSVAIGLEQSRGALIHALMPHGFLVLYPIHSAALKRFREVFVSSGAKQDRTDGQWGNELMRQHLALLRPWKPDSVPTRTLTLLVEGRRKAVHRHTRGVQRLGAVLKTYFPQAFDLAGEDLGSPMACDFLRQWPSLEAAQKVGPDKLRRFYYAHHCRRGDLIEQRLQRLRLAVPLTTDAAVVDSSVIAVKTVANELRALNQAIGEYDRAIEKLFAAHEDRGLFENLPGAGPVLAPRLLVAFGTDRDRWGDVPRCLQEFSGVAPVTVRSGKSCTVHFRRARPKFVHQSFVEFAEQSIRSGRCQWAGELYKRLTAAGMKHAAALRVVAFKWVRVLFRCWKDGKPYDEARYMEVLKKRGATERSRRDRESTRCGRKSR